MSTLQSRLTEAMGERNAMDLSHAIGISHVAVRKWLTGQTKAMKQETCLRAAKYLGVRSDWLGTGRGPKLPDAEGQADMMVDRLLDAFAVAANAFAELSKIVTDMQAERAKQNGGAPARKNRRA
jgi:hypothetical protein